MLLAAGLCPDPIRKLKHFPRSLKLQQKEGDSKEEQEKGKEMEGKWKRGKGRTGEKEKRRGKGEVQRGICLRKLGGADAYGSGIECLDIFLKISTMIAIAIVKLSYCC